MAVIKCKMCGGDMALSADKSFGTCEYCGSTMTLPRMDDEQRAAAFNRGNHFRRIGEFDKALAVYEGIVREDDSDAEAHWCCALCRFGIEYVKDPATQAYLPTCHRASFDSFLEDVDYRAALQYADPAARSQYQKEGEQIAQVQRGILSISQREKPFDVFLCYKETDEQGQRTVDSTLAQDIYYQLTEQGRRVFFARITLEDKAGQAYEPYIFAALQSARVMVVVGTRPEYFNAVWVRNEWSRFLALMKHERRRLLIPCYRDMDPYDLPEQLSVLQSYDMSRIGFLQDLIRGIAKVLDADKKPERQETVIVQGEGGANLGALVKRGQMALEDQEWSKADGFFDQVLNLDAECSEAFLGKALAAQRCADLDALVRRLSAAQPQQTQTVKVCEQDNQRVEALIQKYQLGHYLGPTVVRRQFTGGKRTCTIAAPGWRAVLESAMDYFDHDKLMARAIRYARGEQAGQLAAAREQVRAALQARVDQAEAEDQRRREQVEAEYRAYLQQAEENCEALYRQAREKREADYAAACQFQAEENYSRAAARFHALGDYEDAQKRGAECDRLARQLREKDEARSKAKAKKIGIIGGIAAVIVIAAYIVLSRVIPMENRYHEAEALLAAGNYREAISAFEMLGGYKDSADQVKQAKYDQAASLAQAGHYDEAIAILSELGDYQDSAEQLNQFTLEEKYTRALSLINDSDSAAGNERYEEARTLLTELGDYKDAKAYLEGFVFRPISAEVELRASADNAPDGTQKYYYNENGDIETVEGVIEGRTRTLLNGSASYQYSEDKRTVTIDYGEYSKHVSGAPVQKEYDGNGNLVRQLYLGGAVSTFTYEYNADGTVAQSVEHYGYTDNSGLNSTTVTTYTYDAEGRCVGETQTETSETSSSTASVVYEYDADGNLSAMEKSADNFYEHSEEVIKDYQRYAFTYGWVYAPNAQE